MKLILSIATAFLIVSFAAAAEAITPEKELVKKLEAKVTTHAKSYFKTNAVVGQPKPGGLTLVSIDIDQTKPVPGWTGRYRTEGTATVEPLIRGAAYSQAFEVTLEINPEGVIRIIETKMVGSPR